MQRQTVSFIYDLPTLPVIHFEAEGLTEARLVGRHVAVKKTETPSKRKLKKLKKTTTTNKRSFGFAMEASFTNR